MGAESEQLEKVRSLVRDKRNLITVRPASK